MPIPDGEAYVTIPTHESTAAVPSVPEAQRLQHLLKAAQDLGAATVGIMVRHRGYLMRLSFEPADEEHPWVAVGHVEMPEEGEPRDVCGYGDTPEEALEACADEIDEEESIYVEDADEPEDESDEETAAQYAERLEREHAASGELPLMPGHFIHDEGGEEPEEDEDPEDPEDDPEPVLVIGDDVPGADRPLQPGESADDEFRQGALVVIRWPRVFEDKSNDGLVCSVVQVSSREGDDTYYDLAAGEKDLRVLGEFLFPAPAGAREGDVVPRPKAPPRAGEGQA
jgi:hypothetical protein